MLKVGNYVIMFSNTKWFKLRNESLHHIKKVHFTDGFEVLSKDEANHALELT